jgi:hypothetical protein
MLEMVKVFQIKKIQFTLQDGGSKFQMTDQNQHLIKTFFLGKVFPTHD